MWPSQGSVAYPADALSSTPLARRILKEKPELTDGVVAYAESVRGAILSGIKAGG